jgi:YggT family protein
VQSLIEAIRVLSFVLTLVILADIVVSFFLEPFHPIRQTLDSIVSPMLTPIRRMLPQVGMFDFSPVILLLIIQLIENVIIQILRG